MSVYKKFESAFKNVSAYAILKDGEIVGRVCFKWGSTGAVTAFVHEWGKEMLSGRASGHGYDKQGAALRDAVNKRTDEDCPLYHALKDATYDGQWQSLLSSSGYVVQFII